ncbi:hypothetical protein [Streptomyces sp.]|nr:hypothetical protein [Streptomyces sp.]HET6355069.1 hypothetical protein [Streptomyces sp.]
MPKAYSEAAAAISSSPARCCREGVAFGPKEISEDYLAAQDSGTETVTA